MKVTYHHHVDTVKKKILFDESDEELVLTWLKDSRYAIVDETQIELEAPSFPVILLGRAFAQHLNSTGLLDSWRRDESCSESHHFKCKIEQLLIYAHQPFDIIFELALASRYTITGDNEDVSDIELAEWLYNRIVKNVNSNLFFEMKLKHYFRVLGVFCSINGLEIIL